MVVKCKHGHSLRQYHLDQVLGSAWHFMPSQPNAWAPPVSELLFVLKYTRKDGFSQCKDEIVLALRKPHNSRGPQAFLSHVNAA